MAYISVTIFYENETRREPRGDMRRRQFITLLAKFRWTLVHFKVSAVPDNHIVSQVPSAGSPMPENTGAIIVGFVVIILASATIFAATHTW
jgi:hypothetical protein